MTTRESVSVERVSTEPCRQEALAVFKGVYVDEKRWAQESSELLPKSDLSSGGVSWFLARVDGQPVGVVRLLFYLDLGLYREYGFKLLVTDLDVESFLRENIITEVGRFAVIPRQRGQLLVAAALMRAVATEAFERGASHLVTDVFEDYPHSPYEFHTGVLGFVPVATHDHGELQASNRRITMLLDLRRAYLRRQAKKSWLARYIFGSWDAGLHAAAAGL